ncbi:HNH endonuclease [Pseudoalteromonas luteoviolacea]|uniref:HNH endonuclease n=1 Tax=Pseudoalteromonas luteoviolacea TaxID=43657 RepID=UPI001B3770D6|nr:HNH endonuclease [Pseudoalteromonas luteoviolacea]MBQ4810595.1 HNH endonuclease [Pseudoalteromonas luteoviolacea]
MPSWEQDIVQALENLGGVASYDDIYSEISKIRSNLPNTWKAVIRRRIQDMSSDSDGFKNGQDLFYSVNGLGSGVWGLRAKLAFTPSAVDLPEGIKEPERKHTSTYRVLRDTNLARKLKLLHNNSCQICGLKIKLPNGKLYSEAHHIIPLGSPHNGADIPSNIIVLCPNHHVMCDYGAIELCNKEIAQVSSHSISQKSIDYHNTIICETES